MDSEESQDHTYITTKSPNPDSTSKDHSYMSGVDLTSLIDVDHTYNQFLESLTSAAPTTARETSNLGNV